MKPCIHCGSCCSTELCFFGEALSNGSLPCEFYQQEDGLCKLQIALKDTNYIEYINIMLAVGKGCSSTVLPTEVGKLPKNLNFLLYFIKKYLTKNGGWAQLSVKKQTSP